MTSCKKYNTNTTALASIGIVGITYNVVSWLYRGCTVVVCWLHHGCIMVVWWLLDRGCMMVRSWLYDGCMMTDSWLYHACMMVVWWLSHGCIMIVWWLYIKSSHTFIPVLISQVLNLWCGCQASAARPYHMYSTPLVHALYTCIGACMHVESLIGLRVSVVINYYISCVHPCNYIPVLYGNRTAFNNA